MADGKKTYSLVVNGIAETIDAVKSLNQQLDTLEQKITALSQKTVNVSTGGSTTKTSELSQQDKLEKQILQNEEKMATMRTEEYKALLMQKEAIKEINTEMKANVASENLVGKQYENTMQGLKAQLRDLKAAMQTEDIGSEAFKKMSQEAGVLTQKLKDIEASYGTFSRNVGNYKSAFDDVKKITVTIAGSTREFDNLRQASAELKKELQGLEFNGKGNTKMADDLRKSIQRLESAMSDAKAATYGLDKAMDMMSSFTSMASIGQGLQGFFGVDSSEIQKSMQKLLALQNVMKGIQTLQKQITTGEGVGKYFGALNSSIDAGSKKLLAYNRLLLGTGKAAKIAATGIKVLSGALKMIGVGLAIAAVNELITGISDWIKELKAASAEEKATSAATEASAEAYAKARAELDIYNKKIETFNGTIKEEKELVDELNKKYGSVMGTYQTLAEWKQVLIEKSGDYIKQMQAEAEASAYMKLYEESLVAQLKLQKEIDEGGFKAATYRRMYNKSLEESQVYLDKVTEALKRQQMALAGAENSFGVFARNIRQNIMDMWNDTKARLSGNTSGNTITRAASDSRVKAEEKIQELTLRLMRDGIRKKLIELDNERRKTLEKTKGTAEQKLEIERLYTELSLRELRNYVDSVEKEYNELKKNIENTWGDIVLNDSQQQLTELQDKYEKAERVVRIEPEIVSAEDYNKIISNYLSSFNNDEMEYILKFSDEEKEGWERRLEFASKLMDYEYRINEIQEAIKEANKKVDINFDFNQIPDNTIDKMIYREQENYRLILNSLWDEFGKIGVEYQNAVEELFKGVDDGIVDRYRRNVSAMTEYLKNDLEKEIAFIKAFHSDQQKDLESSLNYRIETYNDFSDMILNVQDNLLSKMNKERKFAAEQAQIIADKEAEAEYQATKKGLEERISGITEARKTIEELGSGATNSQLREYERLYKQLQNIQETSGNTLLAAEGVMNEKKKQNAKQYSLDILKIEGELADKRASLHEKYYEDEISAYNDFITKFNNIAGRQPVKNDWGIINISQTRKNYDEILDASTKLFGQVKNEKEKLIKDFENGLITPEAYQITMKRFNELENDTGNVINDIKERIEELPEEWWKYINEWIQVVGQTMSNIMSSLSEITSNGYDEQIDAQEEYVKKYEDLAKKQEQIAQQHADKINNIESELANARGDRRQHLIDSLNAEIEAQREAVKEQEAAEKRKEEAEHKAAWLEYDQAMARKKMDEAQAALNAAMAISMAAVNHWPIPAVPMMALAAAVGAAQLAAVSSQYIPKPKFEKGGILSGPSHKNGGIPVGNTGIEVEGKEYVIRKKSTEKNVPVLDFINKSERKLTLDDFIDFYSTAPKRTLKSIRNKYADGGILPSPNIDISDLQDRTLVVRDDTPVVVEVKEILDKANSIRKVEALAGLVNKNNI